MAIEIMQLELVVLPGRYDFHGLKEFIKDTMQRWTTLVDDCAIVADFGSEKFAIGSRVLLFPLVPSLPKNYSNEAFIFDKRDIKYLYESCHLRVRVEKNNGAYMSDLLSELVSSVVARGGRVESSATLGSAADGSRTCGK